MDPKVENSIFHLKLRVAFEFERLLKSAPPRPLKKHQLVKLLLAEESGLAQRDLESRILAYYSLPHERRTERQFAKLFRMRAYPWLLEQFDLNFLTATVSETDIAKVAGRLRHHFRNSIVPPHEISSIGFLQMVIHQAVHPRWDQVSVGIDLEVFVDRWRSASLSRYGAVFEEYFEQLELRLELPEEVGFSQAPTGLVPSPPASTTDLNLTQTDLDWMKRVIRALNEGRRLPLYPVQRGPGSPVLVRTEQLVRAAHRAFPFRHPPLEEVLLRVCGTYLSTFRQSA